jgi:hypothetical protein
MANPEDRGAGPERSAPRKICRLAQAGAPATPVHRWIRTRTRIDTGNWLRGGRVYLGLSDQSVLLVAAGHDPYVGRAGFDQLQQSVYNPVTGALLLAPAEGLDVTSLGMGPLDAETVLDRIRGCRTDPTPPTTREV